MAGRARTVFIGTGGFAVPALAALASADAIDLVGVVTAPPRPAGRRGELRASPVATAAAELDVAPVLAPERLRRPEAIAEVLALEPALIVLADYGQIVPAALLDLPFGALNLHPSLLPRHRGAAPVPATILADDDRTGVALMRMDAGLDTGPLVAVQELTLRGDETAPGLEAELAKLGAALLRRSLAGWLAGDLRATPQALHGATLTRPLRRDDGRLDPARGAPALERQVRALQPWPGSWFEVLGGRVTVWRAGVLAAAADPVAPGVIARGGSGLVLGTTDGLLHLVEVQPAGGKRMSGAELLRGRPGLAGALLEGRVASPVDRPFEQAVGYSTVP